MSILVRVAQQAENAAIQAQQHLEGVRAGMAAATSDRERAQWAKALEKAEKNSSKARAKADKANRDAGITNAQEDEVPQQESADVVATGSPRTAAEMWQYCEKYELASGVSQAKGLRNFTLIENSLNDDEKVLTCFCGLHNYVSMTEHDNNYSYAVTSKRIVMAQDRMLGENFNSVSLDNVNSTSLGTKLLMGIVRVDTLGGGFSVGLNNDAAKLVSEKLHEALAVVKKADEPVPAATAAAPTAAVDIAAEIKKFEELLYARLITQEEFDAKRKQLLGL
ncbi:MAG: PH domain-containing protein [Coriobacteriia bacterium]|nr:PH domain-containing protein [Coriobacteriia bacterium]